MVSCCVQKMKVLIWLLFSSLFISCFSDPVDFDISSNHSPCTPFKELLTDWIVTLSISYLADNPKNDQPPVNPQSVVPFTPSGLFKAYYGREASAWEFQSAILDIVYASYLPPSKGKRVALRKQLFILTKAGSTDTARKVFGSILSDIIEEYVGNSNAWNGDHCIPDEHIDSIWKSTSVEFARLRNEVGDLMFGKFLEIGLGTTLAFAIDHTSSMYGEIEAAKTRVKLIIDQVQNTLDRPKDFVLAPFNDPKVGPLTITTDADEFKKVLSNLRAYSGPLNREFPEMSMGGLKLAVEASRPGATIYTITDAGAKDYKLQDGVIAEAQRKRIIVIFMLTNDLSSCTHRGDRRYKQCIDLYEHIAKQTGGAVFVVPKHQVFKATEIIQSNIKQGILVIKQQKITEQNETISFPVDRSISDVEVEAKGTCGKMSVTNSRGKTSILKKSFGITLSSLPVNTSYGEWELTAVGDDLECDVKISARSTFGFILSTFKKMNDSQYRLLKGNPSPDDSLRFAFDPYGITGRQNFKVRLVDETGSDVIPETKNSLVMETNGALGNVAPFRVVVEGADSKNGRFSRVVSQLFKPSFLTVKCDFSNIIFRPGSTTNVNISVHSKDSFRELFVFEASDTKNFASVPHRLSGELGPNESTRFPIRLSVPEDTKDGTVSAVTVTARGSASGSFQYDVCDLVVGLKKRPRIDSLRIKGIINSRFAETVVTSMVTNNADVGREAEFDVMLPVDAVITNLTMKTDNETIVGTVEEKKKAKKIYDKAKKSGKTAGHVAARDSSTRVFKTSMFVEARKNITFELVYQQLLRRGKGRYEYAITLNPEQPVKKVRVDVFIEEEVPIQFVTVPPFKTEQANKLGEEAPIGTKIKISRHRKSAHVSYSPTIDQQTEYSPLGLAGTFEVHYDLQRSSMFGDITHSNGYFAHFFSPPSLPVIPKIVVYLIDVSGSMLGYKMEQVKEALAASLRGLNENDYFNIVFVNHESIPWVKGIVSPGSSISVEDAVSAVEAIEPSGGTDIFEGFRMAFDLMTPILPPVEKTETVLETESGASGVSGEGELFSDDEIEKAQTSVHLEDEFYQLDLTRLRRSTVTKGVTDDYEKIMVFLSDGKASIGETDPKKIVENIENLNQGRVRINTLGFGPLADMKMLRQIAALNRGSSKRVFEELDAAQQIKGFFDDVTNLLLTEVSMVYPKDRVEDLTNYEFETFPSGTEMVVAGRFRKSAEFDGFSDPISSQVRGKTFDNNLELDFDLDPMTSSPNIKSSERKISNFTEKLWAFLRVKELISKVTLEQNSILAEQIKEEALNMSLKYNLVTPYTSMIVITPADRKRIEKELEKAKEEEKRKKLEEEERLKRLEEERQRQAEEEEKRRKLAADRASQRTSTTSPPTRGGGGFYGDPHFLIPVRSDLFICFDWNGEDGEVYNLIHDDVTGLTVNARLVTSPAPENSEKSHRTYISHVAILVPKFRLQVLISPSEITIVPVGGNNYTVPVTSSMTFSRHGVSMMAYDVTRRSAQLKISVYGIVFHVIQRRTKGHHYQADHVDFNVDQYELDSSSHLNGVIGQFLNRKTKLKSSKKKDEMILKINGRSGRVSKHERQHPGTRDKVTCWNSKSSAASIILGRHNDYLVQDVLRAPRFSFL